MINLSMIKTNKNILNRNFVEDNHEKLAPWLTLNFV